MTTSELKRFITRAPKEPGVYIFKDASGTPLYIGKAGNLKNRISAYLRVADTRLTTMVRDAKRVTFMRTDSDIEALLAESRLIKKHRPRFNIMLRDDKQYFFVGFSQEDFPKIFLTHQPTKASSYHLKADFIGPFTDGTALKTTLKLLRTVFPYCTCTQKHHLPCLNAHIGMCLGICCLKQPDAISNSQFLISKRRYRQNIRAIRDVLNGKRVSLIAGLERRMKTLGRQHQLLEARELQRRIAKLRRVFENARINARLRLSFAHSYGRAKQGFGGQALHQNGTGQARNNVPARVEGYDIADIQGQHAVGAMVVFINGIPNKNNYRLFNIKTAVGDTDMLREMLRRRMKHEEWPLPDLVVIDGGKAQLNAAIEVFSNQLLVVSSKLKTRNWKLETIPKVIALTKNEKHRGTKIVEKEHGKFCEQPLSILPPQERNLIVHVDSEAHRFAIRHYRRLHGRALLLNKPD